MAAAAEQIKAKSFTVDGEAVVLRPDGLSRFEESSRREAAHTAIIYALTARICAIADSPTARPHWRGYCAILRPGSYSRTLASPQPAGHFRREPGPLSARLPSSDMRNAATAAGVWLAARRLLTRRFRVFRGRRRSNLLVDFAPAFARSTVLAASWGRSSRPRSPRNSNITGCCRSDTPVAPIGCTFFVTIETLEVQVRAMPDPTQSEPSVDPLPAVRSTDLKNDGYPNGVGRRASIALVRFLVIFCAGVSATLAWQSYGDQVREMIASSYPQLSWLASQAESVPQNAPDESGLASRTASSPDQQQPNAISLDLHAVRQAIDRIAISIASSQEQMTSSADRMATSQQQIAHSLDRIATSQEQMMRSLDQFTADQEQMTREIAKLQPNSSTNSEPSARPVSASAPQPIPRPASAPAARPLSRAPQAPTAR
jgi:hypothetical protein